MRAVRVYLVGMSGWAAWLVAHGLLSLWIQHLNLAREPTALERGLAELSLWSGRTLPFLIIAVALASPLLIPPLAWVVREQPVSKRVNVEPLLWCGVGAGSSLGVIAMLWWSVSPLGVALFLWSGSLSWALSIALAYRVQKRLCSEGRSRLSGGILVVAGMAATLWMCWACILVALVPAWGEWRRLGPSDGVGQESEGAGSDGRWRV